MISYRPESNADHGRVIQFRPRIDMSRGSHSGNAPIDNAGPEYSPVPDLAKYECPESDDDYSASHDCECHRGGFHKCTDPCGRMARQYDGARLKRKHHRLGLRVPRARRCSTCKGGWVIPTGGVCLSNEKKSQIGGSKSFGDVETPRALHSPRPWLPGWQTRRALYFIQSISAQFSSRCRPRWWRRHPPASRRHPVAGHGN